MARPHIEKYFEETILAMADHNMDISKAARQCFVNRNTLTYRLDAIKKETGLDPRNLFDLYKLATGIRGEQPQGETERNESKLVQRIDALVQENKELREKAKVKKKIGRLNREISALRAAVNHLAQKGSACSFCKLYKNECRGEKCRNSVLLCLGYEHFALKESLANGHQNHCCRR